MPRKERKPRTLWLETTNGELIEVCKIDFGDSYDGTFDVLTSHAVDAGVALQREVGKAVDKARESECVPTQRHLVQLTTGSITQAEQLAAHLAKSWDAFSYGIAAYCFTPPDAIANVARRCLDSPVKPLRVKLMPERVSRSFVDWHRKTLDGGA